MGAETKPKMDFLVPADFAEWKERLLTRDDFLHLHKTLGVACLASFLFRVSMIGGETDMGFRSHPHLTIPTLLLHLALSLSSLEFKIPNVRIKEGSRIWPEYRLHSIVFATRSLTAMALYWYEDVYCEQQQQRQPYYPINALIVLATMAAADLSTMSQKHKSKSIRNLDISCVTRYFFSVCQMYATAGVLMGVRRFTIQFLNVVVVQLNPFLMTLRRKNLLSHYGTVTTYGFLLIFGLSVCISEYMHVGGVSCLRTVAFCGNLAILWRMSPLPLLPRSARAVVQNKYLIWSTLAVLVHYRLRPLSETPILSTRRNMVYSCSFLMVLLNCYLKCTATSYCDSTTTAAAGEMSRRLQ